MTQGINQCIDVLSDGGLILYPTDTIWGIGCDATQPHAIEKIFKLKGLMYPPSSFLYLNTKNTNKI